MRTRAQPPLLLVALASLMFAGCEHAISTSLDGKACDSMSRCSSGYVCESGLCVRPGQAVTSCDEDETSCDDACVDLLSDPSNCGGCGATCTSPEHGAGVCLAGECNFACTKPYSACGNVCVDFSSDPDNCGGCAHDCATPSGDRGSCAGGKCEIPCDAPLMLCENECADTRSDPENCGACGHVFAAGTGCSRGA
jgi:hypothetical protein